MHVIFGNDLVKDHYSLNLYSKQEKPCVRISLDEFSEMSMTEDEKLFKIMVDNLVVLDQYNFVFVLREYDEKYVSFFNQYSALYSVNFICIGEINHNKNVSLINPLDIDLSNLPEGDFRMILKHKLEIAMLEENLFSIWT
jgi:hypothetical protein